MRPLLSKDLDDFNLQLHPKSPHFVHQSSEVASLVKSSDTLQWVTNVLQTKRLSATVGGCRSQSTAGKSVASKVPKQDPDSWAALISQHTKRGQGKQALRIYEEMRRGGVGLSSFTFVAAFKACSSLQDLQTAKKIHADVVNSGVESDVYVGTTLVDVYLKCGSLKDARRVFDKMPRRNVISWTAMISGYAQVEEGEVALQLYSQMQQENVVPNDRTFVAALKACRSLTSCKGGTKRDETYLKKQCLERVKAIHSDVVKGAFESDVFVGTMLLDMYAKCGSIVDSRLVFEKMPCRNVVSWNAIMSAYVQIGDSDEALKLYAHMQEERVVLNDRTFAIALKACNNLAALEEGNEVDGILVKRKSLEQVRSIHSDVVNAEFEPDVFLGNVLVEAYAKCGSLMGASHVFQNMPRRNVISWTAMILACVQMGECEEALQLFERMRQEGVAPDARAFVGVLKACSSLAAWEERNEALCRSVQKRCLEQVRAIHVLVAKSGFETDLFVGTMLVDVYAKTGSLQDAMGIFEKMPHRDVVSWNAMILGYAQMEASEKALQFYTCMQQEGLEPNERTFVGVLKACSSWITVEERNHEDGKHARAQCLEHVRAIHAYIVKSGSNSDVFVGNMLVDVYAKCGNLVDARQVFEQMPHRDVVSWNIMILGYAQMEEGEEALNLYTKMQQEGVLPDNLTYVGALKACGSVTGLDKGKEIHSQLLGIGHEITDLSASSLIDMYGKCGSMVDAQQVFDGLSRRDIVTWSALIAGYARQGDSEAVFDLFERLRLEDIRPNSITFLSVLTVCSHVGLVDKGQMYFKVMHRVYGIAPNIDHYTCIIDLLGRAGLLDNAMSIVRTMPFQPDAAVWQTVLGACQKWTEAELGRHAFDSVVRLDKNHAAAYISMTNIYAAAGMWDEARKIQAMRVKAGARKKPGQSSWTDLGGTAHVFVVGNGGQPQNRDVCEELLDLHIKMTEEVYFHSS